LKNWLIALALFLFMITTVYISYHLGLHKCEMEKEKTIIEVAKGKKMLKKSKQDFNLTETKDTFVDTSKKASTFLTFHYNDKTKKIEKYYEEISETLKEEANSSVFLKKTTSSIKKGSGFVVDYFNKGVDGLKELYTKIVKKKDDNLTK